MTCFYCGKKGCIERDCFKRKRDAEQGIVRPVSKNVEKEETTKTAYGLITSDIKEEAQTCSRCMCELNMFEACYDKPKRKSINIDVIEKKEVNTDP